MKGDILTTDADAFVVPVNCVGVMGKGLAHQFKNQYNAAYERYKYVCRRKELEPGKVVVQRVHVPSITGRHTDPFLMRYAIMLATKNHWRNPSELHWIIEGLKSINEVIDQYNIPSIAIPKIGCGYGGLRWTVVKPLVFATLGLKQIEVQIYQ